MRCGDQRLPKTEGIPVTGAIAGYRLRSMGRAVRSPYEIVTLGAVSATTGGIAWETCKAGVSFAAAVRMGARDFNGAIANRRAVLRLLDGLGAPRYCRAQQSPIRRRRQGNEGRVRARWRQGAAQMRRSMRKFAI